MSKRTRRIRHWMNALSQYGFCVKDAKTGNFNQTPVEALEVFRGCRDGGRMIRVPVNALRTVYPSLFSGTRRNCQFMTPALQTSIDLLITKLQDEESKLLAAQAAAAENAAEAYA